MTVLVVGAGPGMGRAVAAALGREHGPVALIARRPASLAAIAGRLRGAGVEAEGFPADITDEQALRAAVEAGRAALGPYSVVVCNASVFVAGPPTRVGLPEFRDGLATGITSALITLQATAADLLASGGTLLFTGGGLALNPSPEAAGLAIQKAGQRSLALAAAAQLRPDGVSVSIVTIRGTIAAGGPFDPDRIATVYAALARPGIERPVEVMVTGEGPDWTPGGAPSAATLG